MKEHLKDILACPECLGKIDSRGESVQCTECGRNYPVQDGIPFFAEIHNDIIPDGMGYAKDKSSWSAFKKRNYTFIQSEATKISKNSVILDLGAGPGFFDDLFEGFKRYYSLDFYNYPNIDIVSNIIEKRLPVQSCCIDCVILSNVLEHLNDPESLLDECFRILTAGGKLIIIVPFFFKIHQEPYDYYRYTQYKLFEMLQDSGFGNVVIKRMGTILEVLNGIKYELKSIMSKNTKHQFILKQFLRLQYHVDNLILKLFLKLGEEELTEQQIFTGYSCTASKPG